MKNIRFERNKDKVLVVAGCSHTQGSAFVRKIARPKLIKGKEYCNFCKETLLGNIPL